MNSKLHELLKLMVNIESFEVFSSDQGCLIPIQYQFLLLFFDEHSISKSIYFNLLPTDKHFAEGGHVTKNYYSNGFFSNFINQNYLLFFTEILDQLMNFR